MIIKIIKKVIKIIRNSFLITLLYGSFPLISYAQGFLHVDGKSIVDSTGNNVLLKGFGLGGWMVQEGYMLQIGGDPQHEIKKKIVDLIGEDDTEVFYHSWRSNHCRKIDIDSLAAWGFNSVRLPMHYNLFTLPIEQEPGPGVNTWVQTGFNMVDSLLEWCQENEMYLILDLHAAPGGQGYDQAISDYDPSKPSLWQSDENRAKTVALWRQIALRYANEPWIGGYDLLNETNWDIPGNGMLKQLYISITNAIREVDANHIIFIEGNWFANDFNGLTPAWDTNMVYSFHKYWSHNNQASIQWMLNIRNTYNRPIWCGESGENSNVWFTDAIKLFEANNIGWAWWPMKKVESISGPLSVKKTAEYQQLLDYWVNGAVRPTSDFAKNTLMELTDNLKLENCNFNKDVIDAMIRQAHTTETSPYAQHNLPGVINAADYDLGQNSHAYFDTEIANYSVSTGNYTSWNNGWHYRNDGVDIEPSKDENGFAYSLGWTEDNEWLKYTINVNHADSFTVSIRVASNINGGSARLLIDGVGISAPIIINSTGGWYDWETVDAGKSFITTGSHELKLQIINSGFNINQIEFIAQNSGTDILAKEIELYQNFPNPFNSGTNISFRLSKESFTNLSLYNSAGQSVRTILNEIRDEGFHTEAFKSNDLASGVYFYKISTAKSSQTRKLVILR